jgi:hypothetical protein
MREESIENRQHLRVPCPKSLFSEGSCLMLATLRKGRSKRLQTFHDLQELEAFGSDIRDVERDRQTRKFPVKSHRPASTRREWVRMVNLYFRLGLVWSIEIERFGKF